MSDTDQQQEEMRAQGDQAPKEAPFKSTLTIIWEAEKRELNSRLDTHAQLIEDLNQRMRTLEALALSRNTPGAGIGARQALKP